MSVALILPPAFVEPLKIHTVSRVVYKNVTRAINRIRLGIDDVRYRCLSLQ